jgi:hypothetical protein
MRKAVLAAVCCAGLGLSTAARAEIGTIDAVPAATLLLPYFEVDTTNPAGLTTLFSINNSSATAVLAHVTLWTDLSVPTVSFDVYLTGYDVQTINVRDILNGNLPQTASDGQDPSDTISPQGTLSQDITFPSCGGLPYAPLPPATAADLRAVHQGQPGAVVLGGLCGGVAYGDGIARGYITVDTVSSCTLISPNGVGYFIAGGTGIATNQNVLWGDYFYVNPAQNFAQGDTLVHIEASSSDPDTSVPGQYTFYGRYTAWTAADNREPLVTSFAARFLNGGAFTGGTSLVAWRDPKVNQAAFTCPAIFGSRPSWYPLGQEGVVIFDEQEHPYIPPVPPFWPPPPVDPTIPFRAAATRAKVGGPTFAVPYTFGWLFLNLNTTVVAAGANPPEDPAAAQAWVTVIHEANGRFSVGYSAVQLDSAAAAVHVTPGS